MDNIGEWQCPRCGNVELTSIDVGADPWEDDHRWLDYQCEICGMRHDGWNDAWYDHDTGERYDDDHR